MLHKNRHSRRTFMKHSVGLGAGLTAMGALAPFRKLARASAATPEVPDRYYVFCYFPGGWDILLSLDPREPQFFNNSTMAVTQIQPGYEELVDNNGTNPSQLYYPAPGMVLGPYMGDLVSWGNRMCVVRGMSMETLTHDVGRRRFLTGHPPSGLNARGSSTDVWLSSHFGGNEPIPNISLAVESYNDGLPTFGSALRANSARDLYRALSPSEPNIGTLQSRQIDELLSAMALCPGAQNSPSLVNAELSRQKSIQMVEQQLDALFNFESNDQTIQDLREQYGFSSNQLTTPQASAAAAAVALMNGVSRVVSISASPGLDTHFDNWTRDQGPNQLAGFNAIATLVDHLDKTQYKNTSASWLDHTTIVMFSEFSRTPLLNVNGGRDHWLGNSCALIGGGVKGGTVIGASSDEGMYPQKVDLTTGELSEDGEVVRPEHVLAALHYEVGIDAEVADLRVGDGLTALLT